MQVVLMYMVFIIRVQPSAFLKYRLYFIKHNLYFIKLNLYFIRHNLYFKNILGVALMMVAI